MFYKKLVLGILNNNTYILSGDGQNAVIIDPADNFAAIESALKEVGLCAMAVLLTHGHFDHYGALKPLQEAGANVYMNFEDKCLIGQAFSLPIANLPVFEPDKNLNDGEVLKIAGLDIKVIHTPGHSAGSVCFLTEGCLFSGDTLFYHYAGRTDFSTGDRAALKKSIREKLYTLSPKTKVYPGHDEDTTIGYEMIHNRIVKMK